jgi:hypothetical protein
MLKIVRYDILKTAFLLLLVFSQSFIVSTHYHDTASEEERCTYHEIIINLIYDQILFVATLIFFPTVVIEKIDHYSYHECNIQFHINSISPHAPPLA